MHWLSLPPEELTATSVQRSIRSRHWGGMGMSYRRHVGEAIVPPGRHGQSGPFRR